jgi:hypothetical protein
MLHSLTQSRVQGVPSMPLHPQGPKSRTLSVVGKNTLWTSKLGSDLDANFDRIETTFLPTTQYLNPFFTVNAWKRTTNLTIGVRCRSSITL